MDTQSLQSLGQLQSLQNIGSSGTTNANSPATSDLFAQMLSELTSATSNQSSASQVLGLTKALSTSNRSNLLKLLTNNLSLMGTNSSMDNNQLPSLLENSTTDDSGLLGGLGNTSMTDYSQLFGGLGSSNYSQLLKNLSNNSNSLNNPNNSSLYYNGTAPVYTPSSVYNSYVNQQSLSNSVNPAAGSANVSSNHSFDAIIKKASATFGIPEKMIKSVIKQESGFNPNSTSSAGAGGLMQLMPGTAKYLGVSNVYNAEQNIMGGTKYLKQLFDKFGGSYKLMLAAYNAGPGAVAKYGGIPPYNETANYVNNIMNTYKA